MILSRIESVLMQALALIPAPIRRLALLALALWFAWLAWCGDTMRPLSLAL